MISIICGFISLYVPETLNRPLPNSVEDVVKWQRTLTDDEWKAVNQLNKKELNKIKKFFKCAKQNKLNMAKSQSAAENILLNKNDSNKSSLSLYFDNRKRIHVANGENNRKNTKSSTLPSLSTSSASSMSSKVSSKLTSNSNKTLLVSSAPSSPLSSVSKSINQIA